MGNDIWEQIVPPSKHNHPIDGTIRDYGVCGYCDEWWRWHNKVVENPHPADVLEKPKRGRKKKDEGS